VIGAKFTCNICGAAGEFNPPEDWREGASCPTCASSVRMRAIVHCLLSELLGRSAVLRDLRRYRLIGVGLSDWDGYARRLSDMFDYANTYFHCEPRLDITAPDEARLGLYDFLISSDVFEHTPPPAARAFDGAFAILRPGGLLVMTVPFGWDEETVEHYPDLHDFSIVKSRGGYRLHNRTAAGEDVVHKDLVFHGGPGTTLEMRLFSLPGLIQELKAAGFVDIKVHDEAVPRWGIFPRTRYGVPVTARKPATPFQKFKFLARRARRA
jgi:SAM-dependent methyltransferase